MKKVFCLCLLSILLLALPLACRAETWAEFVKAVNAETKGKSGEIVYEAPSRIEAYGKKDKALSVPKNVQLIIKGGHFENMLLSSGSVTLREVTVSPVDPEASAICFFRGKKEFALNLTIEESSVVESASGEGIIFDRSESLNQAFPINLVISNYGTIRARIRVAGTSAGSRGVSISLLNYGSIQCGISLRAEPSGTADCAVLLHNEGSIETGEFGSVSLGAYSKKKTSRVDLINAEAGTIMSDLYLSENCADVSPEGRGTARFVNNGKISAERLAFFTDAQFPAVLELAGDGETGGTEPLRIPVFFEQYIGRTKVLPLEEDAFVSAATKWLEKNSFPEWQQGATIAVQYSYNSPDIAEVDYDSVDLLLKPAAK